MVYDVGGGRMTRNMPVPPDLRRGASPFVGAFYRLDDDLLLVVDVDRLLQDLNEPGFAETGLRQTDEEARHG